MQCSHCQTSNAIFANPWYYYWLNYYNWIVTHPSIPTSSTPCIEEEYCLDGSIFNETSCQCEPYIAEKNYSTTYQPPLAPQNITCSTITCPQGKSLDTEKCACKCKNTVRCVGLKKYNFDSCKCQCTYPHNCRPNEYFDRYHCVCAPIITYIQQPIAFPRTQPIIQPIPTTLCIPKLCTGYKQFSTSRCECYCPVEASRHCLGNKILNPDTCQCSCSTSLVALSCSNAQYFDDSDCICKCRTSTAICNTLQVLNSSTCQCECQRVTIRRVILTDDISLLAAQRNKRSTKHINRNTLRRLHAKKRMAKMRKKTNSRTPTGSRGRTSNTQQPLQQPLERQLVLHSCPTGTVINQTDCSCI